MKRYFVWYYPKIIEGEAYKRLIDFAWKRSSCFAVNEYSKNAAVLMDLSKNSLIKVNEYERNAHYFFKLNSETKRWLKSKKGIFDFGSGQDLYFFRENYEYENVWLNTVTHEETLLLELYEDELSDLNKVDKEYGLEEIEDGVKTTTQYGL